MQKTESRRQKTKSGHGHAHGHEVTGSVFATCSPCASQSFVSVCVPVPVPGLVFCLLSFLSPVFLSSDLCPLNTAAHCRYREPLLRMVCPCASGIAALSSRGLGHRPFKAGTGVRIPAGSSGCSDGKKQEQTEPNRTLAFAAVRTGLSAPVLFRSLLSAPENAPRVRRKVRRLACRSRRLVRRGRREPACSASVRRRPNAQATRSPH